MNVMSNGVKKGNTGLQPCFPFPTILHTLSLQPGPGLMPPTKKDGEKKGCSAISRVVTREYTIGIHKHIHGVGFKNVPLQHSERPRNLP